MSTVDATSLTREQLTATVHRIEVAALLDRYLITLDTGQLDDAWAESLFTADAVVEFPVGRHEGIDRLAAFHRTALAKFDRTQHLNSPAVVDLDGDRAVLRANLTSTQVLPSQALFVTGTLAHGEAALTMRGWRLRALSFRLIWKTGEPPRTGGAPRTDQATR
ncbi:nuclear transport factor 2 family protein [Micromonospora sp. KC606]|uniref:nuclear transport factor 2 family protein n=1 Tax=Micromonospora sp. KC606 TaxID=2530379 RepID=UPI00104F59D2|nr:nuclear transport factor 2 family protein [Micromonospora sp. KC606]TDC85985.1 nuclear transport factor 2 family protein [Micromonospora sp. KC606]